MKKQIALLPLLMLLVACGETSNPSDTTGTITTEPSSNTGTNSTQETTSEEPVLPTTALTDSMMSAIKEGYQADYRFQIKYTDGTSGSSYRYEVKAGQDGYAYDAFYTKNDVETRTSYVQIEKKDANDPLAYDVSLGLDNTIWYKPITEEDSITHEKYEVNWDDYGYSNLFALLNASDFTKEDDNTFALSSDKLSEVEEQLKVQLFSPYDLYHPNTDPKYFKLKTNGDKIVGFELEFLPYTSYDTVSIYTSKGSFTHMGADSFTKLQPIQGETKPELDNILNKLKGVDGKQNYEIKQTQWQFDFTTEKMNPMGEMDIKVQDGDKSHWIYKNTNGKRTSDYGYYAAKDEEGNDCKRGVIQLGDNYYNDIYLYRGSMKDYLPSFDISSVLFEKDTAASTNGKIVYKLNKDIDISLDNDSTVFTPEEMDAYRDRIIYLTITEEGDKITIRNTTGDGGKEESGLILNCEYTNIGKVTGLFDQAHMKENVDDLKWSDLLSRNEVVKDKIISVYTQDVLDAIPTLGGTWSNVYTEAEDGSKPIFYVYTYEEETNTELMNMMKEKLEGASFASYTPASLTEQQKTHAFYHKNVNIKRAGKTEKTYCLNVELVPWWNSITEQGQFQICLSLGAALK